MGLQGRGGVVQTQLSKLSTGGVCPGRLGDEVGGKGAEWGWGSEGGWVS